MSTHSPQGPDEPCADIVRIGADLSRAIREDHQRRSRRQALSRSTAVVAASMVALSATALAAGQLTGAVDLGGGPAPWPAPSLQASFSPCSSESYGLAAGPPPDTRGLAQAGGVPACSSSQLPATRKRALAPGLRRP
jgi:hypothetical protein